MSSDIEALLYGLLGLASLGLPIVAAALLAVRLGVRSVPLILCVALAASGTTSMLTFWAYFLPPSVAPVGAYFFLFGSLGAIAWSWPVAARQRKLLRQLAVPLGLWVLATLFVSAFGFMFGGTDQALGASGVRFATDPTPFAADNIIPLKNAEWLYGGHPGSPPFYDGAWHFSDRPPLQVGYVLGNWLFDTGMGQLQYEMLAIALQQLWIVAMWALLLAAGVSVRTRALAILAALVSDVAIVNGFYVWPKLIGAVFILAALALLVSPGEPLIKRRPWSIVLLGALCGFALLSHGSGVFGLVAVAAVALWRGLPSWRWLAAGAVALSLAVLPWMGFQKFVDPPANRLVKLTLGGFAGLDDRGAMETIVDEYRVAGFDLTVDNKYRNFLTMLGGSPSPEPPPEGVFPFGAVPDELGVVFDAVDEGDIHEAVSEVRAIRHWHVIWLLGLLPLGLPLILLGRLRRGWRDGADWWLARFSLVFAAVGLTGFALLMFGNPVSRAIPGSISFAIPLLAMVGIVAGLRATYPRVAAWLVGANVLTTLLLFVPFLSDAPGFGFSIVAAVAAGASLLGVWMISLSEP